MVNGEVKARDISKYLSGTKACLGTIDTKSRGLRNVIASFLILDENRTHLTKQGIKNQTIIQKNFRRLPRTRNYRYDFDE